MRGIFSAAALLLVACYLIALSNARPASAASYVVDLTSGTSTANACTAAASDCSIRGALNRANTASTPGDIITFSPTVFPPGAPAAIGPGTTALPSLTGGTDTIDGTGAGVIIDGNQEPAAYNCLTLDSSNNVVKNIQVTDCAAGIQVPASRTGNTIGPGIVAFDNTSGISVLGNSNTVIGNKLGTNAAGTAVHPSGGNITDGITTTGANITIGSANAADRNIISGNGTQGIRIQAGSTGVTVKGNYIGPAVNGTTDLGNTGNGVTVLGSGNTIGGIAAGEGNVISGNNAHGLSISGATAGSNTIRGNLIGTDHTGTTDLGNTSDGININASPSNIIGGDLVSGGSNVISGNDSDGIEITGVSATGNQITANYVGVTASLASRANSGNGVNIATGSNTIGGIDSARNHIAFNGLDGINITAGTANSIGFNSVFSNTGLGIDLAPDGVTPNDAAPDGDTGANNLQNFPVLTFATYFLSGDVTIQGTLASAPSTTYTLRLFHSASCDVSGNGEGETIITSQAVATDAAGNVAISITVPGGVPPGRFITATATDPAGNTSEFSNCLEARPITVNSTADPGDGVCDITQCTLREAITVANGFTGPEIIEFRIGSGAQSIALTSALPAVTETALLNATTQPGFSGAPLIELNGAGAGAGVSGLILTAPGSTIRGLVINRFSGNGILLQNGANNSVVEGNYIGVNATGTASLGNTLSGVFIGNNSANNTIGGSTAAARNMISGNSANGVEVNGTGAVGGNQIRGNYIGLNSAGNAALGNALSGVDLRTPGNFVGGASASMRNVISGNPNGVLINTGATTGNNSVQGNFIGTDAAGNADIGNTQHGVVALSPGNTIGGTAAGTGNVISGNNIHGIFIQGTPAAGNVIQGNFIGTNAAGTADLGNTSAGIHAQGGPNTVIGGTSGSARNVISGNDGDGIVLRSGANNVVIEGNYIGTNADGSLDLGNALNGLFIADNAAENTIGGSTTAARNVISGNDINGVRISGSGTIGGNVIKGNYVGTSASGAADLGNTQNGVYVLVSNNTIGGLSVGTGNVVSGNNAHGIALEGTGAANNALQGNLIGTRADGTSALGNGNAGVQIVNSPSDNTVGGATPGAANVIAFNGGDGVTAAGGIRNAFRTNSIHSNSGLGIDLGTNGVTANDPGDVDTGANQLQNFPALTSASSNGSALTVAGTLDSTASTAFDIHVSSSPTCDPSGHGEGQTYLGSFSVTTDGSGAVTFSETLPFNVNEGHVIAVTATDPNNNTSEFSGCTAVGIDTDGDSFGSFLGGVPLFSDGRESQLGTNPSLACAATGASNDELVDPYPLDTDDNGFTDITDLVSLTGRFGETQSPSNIRYDFNLDGFIDISDLVYLTGRFGEQCIPP